MNRRLTYIALAGLLTVAGWAAFSWWSSFSNSVWKYISDDSYLVIQSNQLQDSTFYVPRGGINLRELPIIHLAAQQLDKMQLLCEDATVAEQFLKKKQITFSLQKTAKNRFNFVIFVPYSPVESTSWLESPQTSKVRVLNHTFEGERISDVNSVKSEPLFSYFFKNNYLIISNSGFLLEDIIRNSSNPLKNQSVTKFRFSGSTENDLTVYFDKNLFREVFSTEIVNVDDTGLLSLLNMLPDFLNLQLFRPLSDRHFTLGAPGDKINQEGYVAALNDQKASVFQSWSHVPSNTAVMYRLAWENTPRFVESLKSNVLDTESNYLKENRKLLNTTIGVDTEPFYEGLGKELLFCQLEANNVVSRGQLLLQPLEKGTKLEPFIKKLAILATQQVLSPIEKYQGRNIYTIEVPELPALLFGTIFRGFPRSYVSIDNGWVIYSNDPQVLKDYLLNLEYQNTWFYSKEINSYLSNVAKPSNFVLMMSARKSRSYMTDKVLKYVQKKLDYEVSDLFPAEYVTYQAAFKDQQSYASLSLGREGKASSAKVFNKIFLQKEYPLKEQLQASPFAVRSNLIGQEKPIFVTKSNLMLFPTSDTSQKKITQLDGRLVSEIYNIDFLNVGRLQYVLATDRSLYMIDEDDNQRFTIFTKQLPNQKKISYFLKNSGIIAENYRFLVVDEDGNLYTWDRPDETPRKINKGNGFERLLNPIPTFAMRGFNHWIVMQSNGLLRLVRENGFVPPPFPINFKSTFVSPFQVVYEPEKGTTQLVGITQQGVLININTNGEVIDSTQLPRPDPTAAYGISMDKNERDWILLRSSQTQVEILDKKGKTAFIVKDLVADQKTVRYHYFGAGQQFISIKSGNFTTLYNLQGQQIGDKPIPSEYPVNISFVQGFNKIFVYSYANSRSFTWSVKVK